jgi:predicted Zn-dependent protease with MMP-like domain
VQRTEFERIVDEALEGLPAWVVEAVDNLHVVVEDWPNSDQDPAGEGILGVYEGVSLLERGDSYSGQMPDRIVVFMGPHLDLELPSEELGAEIRRTVLHEVAHHLGIDDERLETLDWD